MIRKKALIGIAIVIQTTIMISMTAHAEMFPTETPESGRVPPVITLLANTPFYDKYENSGGPPEGVLAPQDVQVVVGGMPWSNSHNWWKIRTWLGDKWINLSSKDLEVPPPKELSLLEHTPVYEHPDADEQPTGMLSPQDVTIVGAQSQWFAANGYDVSTKKWLQIHTPWLGDQWIQLPLNRIGTVRNLDERAYYLQEGSFKNLTAHLSGEFVSPFFDSMYRIKTDEGAQWLSSRGMKIIDSKQTIKLETRTTLFASPYPYKDEVAILEPQIVESFEQIDKNPYWTPLNNPTWYHVRTSAGEGWINKHFSDPVDAKPAQVAVQLNANTILMSYPTSGIWYKYAQIAPQTIRPTQYWDDKRGNRWYQIDSYVGKTWFTLNPYTDRILLPGAEQAIQLSFHTLYFKNAQVNGDELRFQDRKVGYRKDGGWYVSLPFLSEAFRYTHSELDDTLTFESKTGYAFKVKAGVDVSNTLWNGAGGRNVKLITVPERLDDGELYLSIADIRTLFGSLVLEKETTVDFLLQAYQVVEPDTIVPETIHDNKLELTATLVDNTQMLESSGITNEGHPELTVGILGRTENTSVKVGAELVAPLAADQALYRLKAVIPLDQEANKVRAVLKIGERILWQQDISVTRTR